AWIKHRYHDVCFGCVSNCYLVFVTKAMKGARRILYTVGLRLIFPLLGSLMPIFGFAQKGVDTLISDKNLAGKVLRAGLESLTVSGDTIVNEAAIDQSKPYEGKIIRK